MTLPSPSNSSVATTANPSRDADTATGPLVPLVAPPVAPAAPSSPVTFPLDWVLAHAAAPIQYRSLTEVARLTAEESQQVSALPFTHRPALLLAVQQSVDGTWSGGMLGIPSSRAEHFEGIGTIPAVRRLIEYGWHKDTPPLAPCASCALPAACRGRGPGVPVRAGRQARAGRGVGARGRALLREAAAATLAQAGYEGDPRLRGAARRIVTRMADYLRSPLAQKPFVRQGNQHMLAAEAAPPSIYTVMMLAYMPLFRAEHTGDGCAVHAPHAAAATTGSRAARAAARRRRCRISCSAIRFRIATRRTPMSPFALFWLELMARLGFLKRNENWWKLFERFLDDRDR